MSLESRRLTGVHALIMCTYMCVCMKVYSICIFMTCTFFTPELCRLRQSPASLQAFRMFTSLTEEISPSQCPDFQLEGVSCKIFSCCRESKQTPFACLLGPIKMTKKPETACGEGGWAGCLCLCLCLHVCLCGLSFIPLV